MPVTACDNCHRRKERCLFDDTEGQCQQCKLQQKQCSFDRRGRRMGRPPAVLPYGSCAVINFEASEPNPEETALDQRSPAASSTSHNTDTEKIDSLSDAPYDPPRCSESDTHSFRSPYASLADLLAFVDPVDGFPTTLSFNQDMPIRQILSDPRVFYAFHRKFMIGPTFSDSFRQAINTVVNSADGAVLSAYTAVLSLWDTYNRTIRASSESDLSQASHCLRRLQTPVIVHLGDAAAIVMLGQVLVVYHIIALGTSAHAILRRSLLLVKDWYPTLLKQPSLCPITITPILIDTVESLVRREIPVIRVPPVNMDNCTTVDRSTGLCLGLLYLQYDVCRIGHLLKTMAVGMNDDCSNTLTDQRMEQVRNDLHEIKMQVTSWEPRPSTKFYEDFTQFEVSGMMMQARVYRLATLLVIYRLQYPLGVEDEPARRMAMAIAADLECFILWVPKDERGISIGFPLLVTMLEIDCISERIMDYVMPEMAASTYLDELREFVQLVKEARDSGFRGLWFEIAEDQLTIPVLA